jgi:hypothetical protein
MIYRTNTVGEIFWRSAAASVGIGAKISRHAEEEFAGSTIWEGCA